MAGSDRALLTGQEMHSQRMHTARLCASIAWARFSSVKSPGSTMRRCFHAATRGPNASLLKEHAPLFSRRRLAKIMSVKAGETDVQATTPLEYTKGEDEEEGDSRQREGLDCVGCLHSLGLDVLLFSCCFGLSSRLLAQRLVDCWTTD